jgi:phosphotriesterase-related protein
MPTVNSVLGPVDVNDLGFTLMHEHVLNSSAGIPQTFPELVDRDQAIARGIAALKDAAAEGVRTYVDVTTMDLGRDIGVIRTVAEQVDVHIIAATGIWVDIPRSIARGVNPDQLAKAFIRDIEVGLDGTDIKPGVIKVATTEEGVTPANEVVLRAAARASNHTGVPITTHTAAPERVGNGQVQIFLEEGVDLNRVYIGHSNDTEDLDYLSGLIRQGCYLGMDRYPGGRAQGPKWEERTRVVKELLDMGLVDRVTLSHDYPLSFLLTPEMNEERKTYNPDEVCFINRVVLPRLRELGVSDEAIHTMMVDNPRRYFGGD